MGDNEPKGFKIVDRRGMSDADREAASPPAPSPPHSPSVPPRGAEAAGNPGRPPGVDTGKSPDKGPAGVGGPTLLDLVMTLQMGAMVNLGMVQTSDGRKSPVNLPAAKDSIDILEILQEKTKGNLTEEESGVLTEGLYHLRMAYLATMNAGPGTGGKGK